MLYGTHVRLEPLDHRHVDGLAAAAAVDRSLYQWSPIPQGKVEATSYVDTAIARWERYTGRKAMTAQGQSFAQLKLEREGQP